MVQKLGVSQNTDLRFEEKHDAVLSAKLPTQISEEVVITKALIGNIWRMACDKLIADSKAPIKTKTVNKYEELWLQSEEVCKRENPACEVREIMLTYHALCRQYLGTADTQARRLANLTISRPRRRNKRCLISAPKWKNAAKRIKWKFACSSLPPGIPGVITPCVICGHEISSTQLQKRGIDIDKSTLGASNKCDRNVHLKCLDK